MHATNVGQDYWKSTLRLPSLQSIILRFYIRNRHPGVLSTPVENATINLDIQWSQLTIAATIRGPHLVL